MSIPVALCFGWLCPRTTQQLSAGVAVGCNVVTEGLQAHVADSIVHILFSIYLPRYFLQVAETSPGCGSFPGSLSPSSSDFRSPQPEETSPVVHSCPAWEGLGKGFLDLALGLVAPLDASCPRVARTPSPSLSDQERMENAVKMFNRELDERLGSLMH